MIGEARGVGSQRTRCGEPSATGCAETSSLTLKKTKTVSIGWVLQLQSLGFKVYLLAIVNVVYRV